ncbi:MAG TPA: LLM class flavin-dependent oxidoreductase [Nitrososphaerales archaeon]|nr:LLM class flavin-dependent oxidoreductase [Nitrososphaerales archaeon]
MLEPQEGMLVQDIVSWAEYAERAGYGYIFRSDHILSTTGRSEAVDSPECWVTLGAVAAKTSKVKFGPMVSPIGFRNPALLARMACTLHSYSGGRLVLSLGAGWNKPEYDAHGYEFPKFGRRLRQLVEAVEIIRPLTEGKRVDFDGEYFSAHVECSPKPVGGKIHLVMGGRNPKIVQTIGKFADECNIFSSSDQVMTSTIETLRRANQRKIQISQMGSFVIAESQGELESRIRRYFRLRGFDGDVASAKLQLEQKGVLCGTVDDFVSQVNRRREMGVEKFYFQILFPEDRVMVETLTQTIKRKF